VSTSPEPSEVHRWLFAESERLGISQREFVRQLGLSRQTVRHWFSCRSTPSRENMYRIVRMFELLSGEEISADTLPFSLVSCETEPSSNFGRWILKRMNKRRMSILQLAIAMDCRTETLRLWISQESSPNVGNFMKLVEVLGGSHPDRLLLEAYDAVLEDRDGSR